MSALFKGQVPLINSEQLFQKATTTDLRAHATQSETVQEEFSTRAKARKLSYCKDDRTMRRMYGCPENFRESLHRAVKTFCQPKNS